MQIEEEAEGLGGSILISMMMRWRICDWDEKKWQKEDWSEEEGNRTRQVPRVSWKPKKEMNDKVDYM